MLHAMIARNKFVKINQMAMYAYRLSIKSRFLAEIGIPYRALLRGRAFRAKVQRNLRNGRPLA